jgi:uncharacterized surface protein with fasciclin (FAS1) repeats
MLQVWPRTVITNLTESSDGLEAHLNHRGYIDASRSSQSQTLRRSAPKRIWLYRACVPEVKLIGKQKVKSVYQMATGLDALATWVAAVEVVGLVDLLKGDDYITVFAPNDEAFSKMSRNCVEEMLDDFDRFAANIRYHIAPGRVSSGELGRIGSLRTMLKDDLLIDARRGLQVNSALIVEPDIECRNGVIHIIDSVLMVRKHSKVRAGQFAMDLAVEQENLSRPDLTAI